MSIKKVTVFMLIAVMVLCSAVPAFGAIDYSQWSSQSAYPADIVGTPLFTPVKVLMDKKIITGDSDGLYHPEKNISRAEFATMMAKATNNTGNLTVMSNLDLFTDLDGYSWAKPYINACAQANLVQGIGNSKYAPANNVTYVEVIAVIARLKTGALEQINALGTWPNNYIKYAQMYNLTGDVIITDWNAAATKGDVAKLLYRNLPKDSSTAANVSISCTPTTPAALTATTFSANVASTSGTVTYEWSLEGSTLTGNAATWAIPAGTFTTSTSYTVNLSVTVKQTGKTATTTTVTKTFTAL